MGMHTSQAAESIDFLAKSSEISAITGFSSVGERCQDFPCFDPYVGA
jgi:hypothetical protein